jgi:hypothetical protein
VLAAGVSNTNPTITASDVIPLRSIARADGGERPLLMARFYINGSLTTWSWVPGDADATLPTNANIGRFVQVCTFNGDAVTTLSNTMTLDSGFMPQVFVEFFHDVDCQTVMVIGDSLTECNSLSADRFAGWGHRACYALSIPTAPKYLVNLGFSAQTGGTYWTYAKKMLASITPDVAILAVFSPNDNANDIQRHYDSQLFRANEFLSVCAEKNIQPIFLTGCPKDDLSLSYDNYRKTQNSKIIAMAASSGAKVIDFAKFLGNGASPEKFIDAYKFDNTHFNETAIENALKGAVIDVIKQC